MIISKSKILINITPFIDIILIFLFLFFYLYKKESSKSLNSSKIDLIEKKISSTVQNSALKKSVVIEIQKDSKIYFNQKLIDIRNLKLILNKHISYSNKINIFLYVDQNLPIQFLLNVYGIFEELNCENQVILLVKNNLGK